MKVIERFEVEYVVPEDTAEQEEIKRLIADFENPKRSIDLKNARVVDNTQPSKGYWLRK